MSGDNLLSKTYADLQDAKSALRNLRQRQWSGELFRLMEESAEKAFSSLINGVYHDELTDRLLDEAYDSIRSRRDKRIASFRDGFYDQLNALSFPALRLIREAYANTMVDGFLLGEAEYLESGKQRSAPSAQGSQTLAERYRQNIDDVDDNHIRELHGQINGDLFRKNYEHHLANRLATLFKELELKSLSLECQEAIETHFDVLYTQGYAANKLQQGEYANTAL